MFESQDFAKLPGHWVLARLGKRVLRPGGMEMTRFLVDNLRIGPVDDLVEYAPGMGATLRSLQGGFHSYRGVEQNPEALQSLRQAFAGDERVAFLEGNAESPPLQDASASVLWGEAIMTMQSRAAKSEIVKQAVRLLRPGGRYAMHEIALREEVDEETRRNLYNDLAGQVKMPVRPLKVSEWRVLLEEQHLQVRVEKLLPMHLLEPRRMLADEGVWRTLGIMRRILLQPEARARVLGMRRMFRKYAHAMAAVGFVCDKPE